MSIDIETRTIHSVTLRTIPILFTMLFFSYLDRVNVGFAALRMNQDLGFTASVFGFGAGVFFVGYALLEVPSNLMLYRLGARRWFCIVLVTWGGVAALMALTQGPLSFYLFRFVLGLAEGGLMPGVIYYLTSWFPTAHRARANAKYIIASTLAPTIGAPISGLLLTQFEGVAGLPGWQWMFILEGVPTVLLGFVVLAFLPDRPETAHFLTPEERGWLVAELAAERQGLEQTRHYSLLTVARDFEGLAALDHVRLHADQPVRSAAVAAADREKSRHFDHTSNQRRFGRSVPVRCHRDFLFCRACRTAPANASGISPRPRSSVRSGCSAARCRPIPTSPMASCASPALESGAASACSGRWSDRS